MREGISGAWLMQITTVFILLFSGYLALSMNMSKANKVKNEIITVIERQNGLSPKAREQIGFYLKDVGYRTTGMCDDDWQGYDLDGTPQSGRSHYCVLQINNPGSANGELPPSAYFKVVVFFQMDLPIFGDLFRMHISTDSKIIYYPTDIY